MSYSRLNPFKSYKHVLKLTNYVNDVTYRIKNLEPPEKLKGTFLHRWGLYWKRLLIDYKDALVEFAQMCKNHPIKASKYASILAGGIYLHKHVPDESSFKDEVLQNTAKLMEVGKTIRNPISEEHVQRLGQSYNEGTVRWMNLGILSLIWLDDYDKSCALYKATCPYLQIEYLTFYQRIVDVGFLGKWWIIENKMTDYDVNEEQFKDVKYE